jgi:hypothetical protein
VTWRSLLQVVLAVLVPTVATGDSKSDEEPSFGELDVVNSPTTKTELLERTLDRAESVLEEQLTTLDAIQEKAIRMVRVEVVLLGAIASISQLLQQGLTVNVWLKVSDVLLTASMVAGIFTSSSSSRDFGPGPDYVRPNIESGDANTDVYLELLQEYSEAISYNRRVVNDVKRYLFVTQVLFVAGIITGSIGIVAV